VTITGCETSNVVGRGGESSENTPQNTADTTSILPDTKNYDSNDTDENSSSSSQTSELSAKGQQDDEPALNLPKEMSAETLLEEKDIARSGGVDAFFWVEPIPNEVFARMEGRSFGKECGIAREDLRFVRVLHADAEGRTLVGELVVNAAVADEVLDIFRQLYDARYPIRRMRLVDDYGADDYESCLDDNTSAFNWRTIAGTSQISNHALGLAIDINTYENPYYIVSSGYICPPDGWDYLNREADIPYMIHRGDLCHELFMSHGWSWGGDWGDPKDYQHFEKPYAY
jgi:hypothetical protein